MKYKRKDLDRAGAALIGLDPFKRLQALDTIADWRKMHLPVLRELYAELTEYLKSNGITFEFSSHRIKRTQAIIEKLENNKDMGLGGLHDIGGIRFVFSDMDALAIAEAAIVSFQPKNFTRKDKVRNYIKDPKPSGYRGIHYVYKYESENEDYDGLQIELQIRTKLQHSWAMAVETASLISGASLKAPIHDGNVWRSFFRLTSAVFSRREDMPVVQYYAAHTDEQLCAEYFSYVGCRIMVDRLKSLNVAVGYERRKRTGEGYCLLVINFVKKKVYFKYFDTAEEAFVADMFAKMERSVTSIEAVLMVSMEKIEEIQKAYPSYFLVTNDFVDVLEDFEKFCKLNYPRLHAASLGSECGKTSNIKRQMQRLEERQSEIDDIYETITTNNKEEIEDHD